MEIPRIKMEDLRTKEGKRDFPGIDCETMAFAMTAGCARQVAVKLIIQKPPHFDHKDQNTAVSLRNGDTPRFGARFLLLSYIFSYTNS